MVGRNMYKCRENLKHIKISKSDKTIFLLEELYLVNYVATSPLYWWKSDKPLHNTRWSIDSCISAFVEKQFEFLSDNLDIVEVSNSTV